MNQSHSPVILSGVNASRSEASTQSKDPMSPYRLTRLRKASSLRIASFLLSICALSAFASAQTLTGTVKNATTGKPAAGDEVVLLSLGQGMEEAGRTTADAKGNFSFKLDGQGPHLIRVIHQEVTYHRMAPPGTTSVDIEVYDVGKKVEGIDVIADIMRFQAGNGTMQVERTFAVQNNSKPPRTQMNEHNLEFYVPEGAKIEEGEAMTAGGQPLKSAPVPEGGNAKNRYSLLISAASRRDPLQRRLHASLHRQRQHRSQTDVSVAAFCCDRSQDDAVRPGAARCLFVDAIPWTA